MKISFIGDISLNDSYRTLSQKGINPFLNIEDILFNTDHLIGNLESTVENPAGENTLKVPRIKTDISTLSMLKKIRLGTALLANNHIYDNLFEGFKLTIDFLKDNSINYLGVGLNVKNASDGLELGNELKSYILNYVSDDTNASVPTNAKIKLNRFNLNKAVEEIRELKNRYKYIIVTLHWTSEIETGSYPSENQRTIAYSLIDAGASLIIGHHSHTVQPHEIYKGKSIFYSLGNFCFSDIKCDDKIYYVNRFKGTKSLMVCADISESGIKIKPYFFKNINLILYNDRLGYIKYFIRNKIDRLFMRKKLFRIIYSYYFHFLEEPFNYFFGRGIPFFRSFQELKFNKIVSHLAKIKY